MSQQSTNEVHIHVADAREKDAVRQLLGKPITQSDKLNYEYARIYSIDWCPTPRISPNSPSLQVKPMVNLKELQEIVLLISLGIPAEEAISTITKQGYDS